MMKRMLSLLLALVLAFGLLGTFAFAEDSGVKVVNLGDSVACGYIENSGDHPEYNMDNSSYSALFAESLGTQRINYARKGMQTTDILYMIDDEFHDAVDSGMLHPDTWHQYVYPPYDGTPLEQVKRDIAEADYISMCVGACDFLSYPSEKRTQAAAAAGDRDEAKALLQEYLDAGKLDLETFAAFENLLEVDFEHALTYVNLVADILEGYAEFSVYYPTIVKDLRAANKDAVIILVGLYLPGGTFSFLRESEDAAPILHYVNRLLDNINYVAKLAAVTYGCVYVDTMGVESDWHPTIRGHEEIYERIVSVLGGEKTYAGGVSVLSGLSAKFRADLEKLRAAFVRPADVPESHWALPDIEYCYTRGFMNGTSETLFAPDLVMTRAMLAAVLYRMAGSPDVSDASEPFFDVSDRHWAHDAIVWAYQNGIAMGVGDAFFAPAVMITRQQMVTMLYRYAAVVRGTMFAPDGTELKGFLDGRLTAPYAADAMAWAVSEGVIQGVSKTLLAPASPVTRAQCAVIIARFDRMGSEP